MTTARLDTHALPDLTLDEIQRIDAETGNKPKFETRRTKAMNAEGQMVTMRLRMPIISNDQNLRRDTQIATEAGIMTLGTF